MPERINKLQPDRTIQLRGFDSFASAAAVHSATANSFKVSGTFRDPADFAVVVLHDADNFYEHPSIKHLPDFDFSGLTLNFDLHYSAGLQPIDSPKYNWIDWATLDCILTDDTTPRLRLWDHATLASPSFPAALAVCELIKPGDELAPYDQATLWYQNLAFGHVVPAGVRFCDFSFFAADGPTHTITVAGHAYTHTQGDPLVGSDAVALELARLVSADPSVSASASGNTVRVSVRPEKKETDITVSATGGGSVLLRWNTIEKAAKDITDQVNGTDWISAGATHSLLADVTGSTITITAGRYGSVEVNGASVRWLSADEIDSIRTREALLGHYPPLICGSVFTGVLPGSPVWVGGTLYSVASVESPTHLTLDRSAGQFEYVQYVTARGGAEANSIVLNALASMGSTLRFAQSQYPMTGGSSDVTWHCSIDFTALGIDSLRQCWLTFAPSLVSTAYTATEWEATFSNWNLSGDPDKCALKVAGPGSVRIEETDTACVYQGDWAVPEPLEGFFSKYFVKRATVSGSSVTVTYYCQSVHDLYVGTSVYVDYATAAVRVDGDAETTLDCRLRSTGSPIVTRRRIRTAMQPGRHVVTITLQQNAFFFFDFLEAAVVSDYPDALEPRDGISPAIDFDTDHTYKLSPARLMWIFDKLGYAGPMNEYLGVFWWNQRVRPGAIYSTVTIDFTGPFQAGDSIVIGLNGTSLGKSIFAADDAITIARHFATFINGAFVGARAEASGSRLTIIARSPSAVYNLFVSALTLPVHGTVAIDTAVATGSDSAWLIDDTDPQPMNRAARDWHADFYTQCASRNRQVVTAGSMELVYPPAGYVAMYADGTPVETDTGFGILKSNHCAAGSSNVIAFQKKLYRSIARLQAAAGLTPWVQFGEFFWWFFEKVHLTGGGMPFYDAETKAAAVAQLGRDLHPFSAQDDDPMVNGGLDAVFLRDRLRDHVAALVADVRSAFPAVRCEVLWAYDVNYPARLSGVYHDLGGRLNRFINLPVEWQRKETSGLDAVKVEALAFSTGMRDLDLAREAINLFPDFGWPLDSVRYLVPVFGRATPWNRELALAREAGIRECNLWAFDHICLYNLDVPEKGLERRSVVKTA